MSTNKVYDPEAALARLGGNQEIFDELVRMYFEDSTELLRDLSEGAALTEIEQIERAAHSLKSLAANFDAQEAVQAAFQVEDPARRGELSIAIRGIPEVERQFERLRHALTQPTDFFTK